MLNITQSGVQYRQRRHKACTLEHILKHYKVMEFRLQSYCVAFAWHHGHRTTPQATCTLLRDINTIPQALWVTTTPTFHHNTRSALSTPIECPHTSLARWSKYQVMPFQTPTHTSLARWSKYQVMPFQTPTHTSLARWS